MRWLIATAVLGRMAYVVYLTSAQYALWASQPFTKLFLIMPAAGAPDAFVARFLNALTGEQGYFWYYSFGRFWLPSFLAVGVALVMHLFLTLVKKIRPAAFTRKDHLILLAAGFVLPWPLGIAFYPLTFFFASLFAAGIKVFRVPRVATMAPPAVLACALAIIFHEQISRILLPLL